MMRSSLVTPSLYLLANLISPSTALEALTSSPCAVQCGNVLSGTSGSDITCQDSSYASSAAGTTFQSCISCQLTSTYVDPVTKQTDLQWGLYNLRYAISWCLWGFPNNTAVDDTPCITSTACGPLQNAIEFDSLSLSASEYAYCPFMNSISIPKCSACLSVQTSEFYLVNFLTALTAGCNQQPAAGSTISIQGSVFSTTPVNITSPSATPAASFGNSGGLTLGAKIGIAVAALLLILGVTGFCIIWNGRRRRRAVLARRQKESGFFDWRSNHQFADKGLGGNVPVPEMSRGSPDGGTSAGPFFDSPNSQRPLHPWAARQFEDDSPQSAAGEKIYFSPYSSHYTSPVSAVDQVHMKGQEWPVDRKGSLGGNGPSRSRSTEERMREPQGFEMQNVTPVLQHPGNGRGQNGLTAEDARNGRAL